MLSSGGWGLPNIFGVTLCMEFPLKYLTVYDPEKPKKRYGRHGDGGYVVVEGFSYDNYISCGIGPVISFDMDFLNAHTVSQALIFDGTLDERNRKVMRIIQRLPENLKWIKKNIAAESGETTTSLQEEISSMENVFLKMDIEWGEYPWAAEFPLELFKKISQFVVEVHDVTKLDRWKFLERLSLTHYLCHVHGNNYGPKAEAAGVMIPDTLELTYVRKTLFAAKPPLNKTPFPQEQDFPNCPNRADYVLDFWPFVSIESA